MDDRVKVQVDDLLVSPRRRAVIVSLASALRSMPVYRSYSGSTFSFARHIGMRSLVPACVTGFFLCRRFKLPLLFSIVFALDLI